MAKKKRRRVSRNVKSAIAMIGSGLVYAAALYGFMRWLDSREPKLLGRR